MTLQIAQDETADRLLNENPFAVLMGMLLDQQYPMERAFQGPARLASRFGELDPGRIAMADPEEFAAMCSTPPSIHRYPGAMAARVQALATHVVHNYDGDTAAIWEGASSGRDLLTRLKALPGFGDQKARIFTALVGKQLGAQPHGWKAAAGDYAKDGYRSVADVVDAESLAKVRAYKQRKKMAARVG